MEIELRPLSTGEVLDRTFRLYRAQFGVFVGIAALAALLETAGNALQTFAVRYGTHHIADKVLVNALFGAGTLVQLLVVLVAASVVFAVIARAVMALHQGQPIGISAAYKTALPRWFRYVRLAVAWWFLAAWPFIVASMLLVIPLVGVPGAMGSAKSPAFIGAMLVWGGLMMLSVPLCIWLLCRYALCLSASAIEDLNVGQSLKRSAMLSKGLRWRIFLLLMVVYVLQMILGFGLMAPIMGFFLNLAHTHGQLPLGATIYQLAVGFVTVAVITPIYVVGLTLIYLDARIRKEGYDIELMMQRSAGEPTVAVAEPQPGDSAPFAMG